MARTVKPLTDTKIKQARPQGSEYSLADGAGLYIRIKNNGTKLWIFNYAKPYTKQRTNLSLGVYPEVSLRAARKCRSEFRTLLSENVDPKVHRLEKLADGREAHRNTLEVVYQKWLLSKQGAWRASYKKRLTKAVELHLIPALGSKPIHTITAPEVIRVLSPLSERSALETIQKLCRWVNEIMVFAANSGLIHSNPLAGIRKAFPSPVVTHHPSVEPRYLPQLLDDIEQAKCTATTRYALLWLLHTMSRPDEGVAAQWDEINLEKSTWEVPPERMKKSRRHVVPLTEQMLEILGAMRPISEYRKHIFPSRSDPKTHLNSSTPNTALRRMGYKGRQVAHGFRSLSSTILHEEGFENEMIEFGQSRVTGTPVSRIYNRAEYLEKRRVMMEWWSRFLMESQPKQST